MIKQLKHIRIALVTCLGLLLGGCAEQTIIPDDVLAQIFSEAYIQNAYVTNYVGSDADTVDYYTPIFAKYGYTEEDVRFTIGNFSKRKSAKLSDVVDEAILIIERQRSAVNHKIAVRDTLREIARRRFVRTIYFDPITRIRRIEDTSRLNVRIPITEAGEFEVTYSYMVDSTDKNHSLRTRHYMLNYYERHTGENVHRMRRNSQRGTFRGTFRAEELYRFLVLDLNPYGKDMTKPCMQIDSLTVRFYMADDKAQDSLRADLLRKTIPADYQRLIKPYQDSLARRDSLLRVEADSLRRVDSLRIAHQKDSLRIANEKDSLTLGADTTRVKAQ